MSLMGPINFYSTTGYFGCFSNFSQHPVIIDDLEYQTSEHYYQAMKFTDPTNQEIVRLQTTPRKAADMGRRRDFPMRQDWDKIKDDVMMNVIKHKFTQNPQCLMILLYSNQRTIVEHTNNDSYWGDGGDGTGLNKLGLTLMAVRSIIQGTLESIQVNAQNNFTHNMYRAENYDDSGRG